VTRQSPGAASGAGPRQDFALAISNGVPATTAPDGVAGTADLLGSMAVAH
jgi:hypothetical protein